MRKRWIVLGIVLLLLVAAVLALPYLIDVNRYHDRIQAELATRVGRQVSLGPMRLSLVPFAIHVQGATIAEDPSFGTGRVFAQAEEIYVRAAVLPLLRGEVQLQSLELEKPRIELIRNAEGIWNFATLGQHGAMAQSQRQFALDRLRIQDGQIGVTDFQKREPRAVYDHIDLAVENYRPGQSFQLDLAAHLPGQGKQSAHLTGTAGPMNANDTLATPFDGTLKLEEVSIGAVQRFLKVPALAGTDGIASGEASVKSGEGKLASKGSIQLQQPKIRGVDLGYPIALDYEITGDPASNVFQIQKGTLRLGSTPLSVTGMLNGAPTPMQIDLRVTTADAPIAEVARLAGAFGVAFDPGTKIDGRIQADIQARGAATQPLLNGSLSAKNLSISGKGLKQPVAVQGIQLTMSPQEVHSNEFAATTAGTTVAAQFALTQYSSGSPHLDAAVRTTGAQLDDVLNIARAYGIGAAEDVSGSGRVTLDVRASGPWKNASAMALAGTGALEGASLQVPALGKPLVVRHADLRFTQNSVVLENLDGALGSTNASGTVTLRNFASPQAEFSLAADKLNLGELPSWFAGRKQASSWSVVPVVEAAGESAFLRAVGHGKVTVGTVLYDQLVLTNAKSDATLEHGIIRLAPLTAEVYGGVQSGSIVIDTHPTPIQYTVNTKMERVDANKLLSATTSLKQVLFGLLLANAETSFRSGSSSDQIARSLNGNVALDLRNGKIANMDLWYELANAGRFLGTGQRMQPFTNLLSMTGNFDVQNGVARTNNLKAVIDGATVTGDGAANLVDQSLDMHMLAVLSKQRSQEVGGTGIGGFMLTALANENGELVIPVLVSGSFSSPRFTPDLQRIAKMKLEQTISNPMGTAGGILGGILGGKKQPQKQGGDQPQQPQQQPGTAQPQPQQPPANNQQIWQQILDAATKRKQQSQPQPPPKQPEPPPDQPK